MAGVDDAITLPLDERRHDDHTSCMSARPTA
jgi:hypothetical protein